MRLKVWGVLALLFLIGVLSREAGCASFAGDDAGSETIRLRQAKHLHLVA